MDREGATIATYESDRNEFPHSFSTFIETGSRSRKVIFSVLNTSESRLKMFLPNPINIKAINLEFQLPLITPIYQ